LQTFETARLAEEENFEGLARLNRARIGRAEAMDSPYRTVLDAEGHLSWRLFGSMLRMIAALPLPDG
jgi:hypothetical protein